MFLCCGRACSIEVETTEKEGSGGCLSELPPLKAPSMKGKKDNVDWT